jgi:DNA-directed RNA polymerase specialized sigma24 family protein
MHSSAPGTQSGSFRTTQWTLVFNAADGGSPSNSDALEELCRSYWFPIYVFLRRKGYAEEQSRDLTQSFFARILAKNSLSFACPRKGKFRTFLLSSLNNFLANEWDRLKAQKRGGDREIISLDCEDAENRYAMESSFTGSPELHFDRKWAQEVMRRVMAALRAEFDSSGKSERFEHLKGFLLGDGPFESYAAAAKQLNTTEQAIKGAVLRLRRRVGEALREEIAGTVENEAEAQAEIRYLLSIM